VLHLLLQVLPDRDYYIILFYFKSIYIYQFTIHFDFFFNKQKTGVVYKCAQVMIKLVSNFRFLLFVFFLLIQTNEVRVIY